MTCASSDLNIARRVQNHLTALVTPCATFANFPDFTWRVFDNLVQYQKNDKQRNKYYERLVQAYEAGGRPDLACEARLLLCDYLLEEGRSKDVIAELAYTNKKFPEEGRYVPRLLDKLETVCEGIKGADQQLLQFYQEFIPMIPQKKWQLTKQILHEHARTSRPKIHRCRTNPAGSGLLEPTRQTEGSRRNMTPIPTRSGSTLGSTRNHCRTVVFRSAKGRSFAERKATLIDAPILRIELKTGACAPSSKRFHVGNRRTIAPILSFSTGCQNHRLVESGRGSQVWKRRRPCFV
jgi:hypothetical protein